MIVLCLTSNGYARLVEPFLYYWQNFAGADHRVTVAHYDDLPPRLPFERQHSADYLYIGEQARYSFSSGLAAALDELNDDLILLMLEDYWLTEKVDWQRLNDLTRVMRRNEWIKKIDLSDDRMKYPHGSPLVIEGVRDMIMSTREAPYQASLQAAIWRRDFLRSVCNATDDPWQFERYGTTRIMSRYATERFAIFGTTQPVLHYTNAVGGQGNHKGVVSAKHMPAWQWSEAVGRGWAG